MFSWSACVISRVLSCFYLLEGGAPFLCFCCVRSSCLAERCYFSSFGLVLGGSWQDRVFFMTLFFCVLESWTFGFFCWMLLFLEFWLVFMCLVQDQDFENYLFSTSAVICRQALLLNSLCC